MADFREVAFRILPRLVRQQTIFHMLPLIGEVEPPDPVEARLKREGASSQCWFIARDEFIGVDGRPEHFFVNARHDVLPWLKNASVVV